MGCGSSTRAADNGELNFGIKLDLKEIFESFSSLIGKEVLDNLIKNQSEFNSIINDICEAECNENDDMLHFKNACKNFINECMRLGLPTTKGDRKNFILWSNGGLSSDPINPDPTDKGELAKAKYSTYINDTDSPPFTILWEIVKILLEKSKDQEIELKSNSCLLEIKNQQSRYVNCDHIPYDRPLSEVYAEIIPKEELGNVKIEVGQHNDRFENRNYMRSDSVFMTSELPIFLKRVAEYNLKLENKEKKIDVEKCLNIGEYEEKELPNKCFKFQDVGREIAIKELYDKIETKIKNQQSKGITNQKAKEIIGKLVSDSLKFKIPNTIKEATDETESPPSSREENSWRVCFADALTGDQAQQTLNSQNIQRTIVFQQRSITNSTSDSPSSKPIRIISSSISSQ